ncbi:MAG: DUF4907 domain-containing protein [Chitinophagales bacterium]
MNFKALPAQTHPFFKTLFTILLIGVGSGLFAQTSAGGTPSFPSNENLKQAKFTYRIITATNNTSCYDILMDGKLFIHQTSIPGMPGNEGFKTKEQAGRVAELVIQKLKNGEMPPTVSEEEMRKLKAL